MAGPHRRILLVVLAVIVTGGTAAGSLAVFALMAAPATASATATPTATDTAPDLPSPSPSATPSPSVTPTATATPTIPLLTPSPTPSPSPTLPPAPSVNDRFVATGTEPTISADPFNPGVLAVASQNLGTKGDHPCSWPTVRVSNDGGATWGAPSYPWGRRCEDIHAVLAWGPNGRLWAADAVGVGKGVSLAVSHSDNFGKNWSKSYIERFTPPWVGCYPAIAVDNWPGSPNFGTVYLAYNWLAGKYGPGVSLMASHDGSTWVHTEVPVASGLAGYPYSWRLGYRIKAAPDGTAVVTYYQSSLRTWSTTDIFNEGWGSNIGRMGYEAALVHFDGPNLSADAPTWVTGVDHTGAQWQSGLAVDDAGRAWLAVETHGRIRFCQIGGACQNISVPGKSSYKPSLAISGNTIFLGWHARVGSRNWTYYTFSFDGGKTFLPPALVTKTTWHDKDTGGVLNGVGMRETADFQNGFIYFAYGDARSGLAVYVAQIQP